MHSDRLFYEDSYRSSLDTQVHSCVKHGEYWQLVCKESIFYPEGGGQPGDRGSANGVAIVDTRQDAEGSIVHYCTAPLSGRIQLVLDWEHRYRYMVAHTAQHLISAQLAQQGYATQSVHLSEQSVYIDVDADELPESVIDRVQIGAQECIHRALPITAYTTSTIEGITLRRPPSQKALTQLKSGGLRIVEIKDTDRVACAGVHLASCAEIDLVVFQSSGKINRRLRSEWLVGKSALKQIHTLQMNARILKQRLSSSIEAIPERVQALQDASRKKDAQIRTLKRSLAAVKIETHPRGLIALREDEQELLPEIIPTLLKQAKASSTTASAALRGVYCRHSGDATRVEWVFVNPPRDDVFCALYTRLGLTLDSENKRPVLKGSSVVSDFEYVLEQLDAEGKPSGVEETLKK